MELRETERFYPGEENKFDTLSAYLEDTYRKKGYEVQTIPTGQSEYVVQMKNESTLKNLTGLSEALSVSVRKAEDGLHICVGKARWLDKVGVGLFGTFVILAPLLVTAGYGAYKQYKLVDEVWASVNSYMGSSGTAVYSSPEAAAPERGGKPCPACGKENAANSKFCVECGAAMSLSCPACGAVLTEKSKFCPECGAKLND